MGTNVSYRCRIDIIVFVQPRLREPCRMTFEYSARQRHQYFLRSVPLPALERYCSLQQKINRLHLIMGPVLVSSCDVILTTQTHWR